VILDCEIAPLSASLRRENIVIAAVSGKRATIFFFSSCFFAAGWVSQLALDIFYPPLAVLNGLRSSGPAMLLGTAYFGTVLLGLVLFIFGMGSFFIEACGFKRKVDEFVLRIFSSRLAVGRVAIPRIGVPRKDRSD
jgi:hypothetical protein